MSTTSRAVVHFQARLFDDSDHLRQAAVETLERSSHSEWSVLVRFAVELLVLAEQVDSSSEVAVIPAQLARDRGLI